MFMTTLFPRDSISLIAIEKIFLLFLLFKNNSLSSFKYQSDELKIVTITLRAYFFVLTILNLTASEHFNS
jgi:hypothetical protein